MSFSFTVAKESARGVSLCGLRGRMEVLRAPDPETCREVCTYACSVPCLHTWFQ